MARLRHHGFSTPLRLGSAHSANIGSDALCPLRSVPYAVLPSPRFVSGSDSSAWTRTAPKGSADRTLRKRWPDIRRKGRRYFLRLTGIEE